MKISRIIKSAALITILGLGTAFSASADLISDAIDHHNPDLALINAMGGSLLEAYASNPSLRDQIICFAVANYTAALGQVGPAEYAALLDGCGLEEE